MVTSDELNRNEKREIFGAYKTNKLIRLKIDILMESMAKLECTLGIDSTDNEINKVKQKQLLLLSKIKNLDSIKYDILKKVI